MKGIYFLLLLSFSFFYTSAQESIKGKIVDKGEAKPLENASVILLTTDSILSTFARTTETGNFELKNVANGSYFLLFTYPKYELISQKIDVKSQKIDLGQIELSSRSLLIEEVVITQNIPIRIKGDTIEYNASSFKTEQNAKLEDLFRRLPGMTVSADGTVTANGKTVSKVLIDGEEFFGYDPKIAIRNVRADAVDKVQVYERRSERSELTGIDDGERIQTVNVKLKDEAKVGIFGNIEGNYGTNNLYDANLFIAKFNRSERFGVTGNLNNMGNTGGGGRIRTNNQIRGNPTYQSIGGNYENRLFQNRMRFNSNYNYSHSTNENQSESYNKELLPEQIRESNNKRFSESENQNHGLRVRSDFRIDSIQNLNLQFNASIASSNNSDSSRSITNTDTKPLLSDIKQANESFSNKHDASLRLDYRRRLNNNGRSLNIQLNTDYSDSDGETKAYSYTEDYSKKPQGDTTIIDQIRANNARDLNLEAQVNISEQFWANKLNVTLGYNFQNTNRAEGINAIDKLTGKFDSLYSKDQVDNLLVNGGDLNLNFNHERWNVNVSNSLNNRIQKLGDDYRDIDLERSFWQNNLNTSVNFKISNAKNIKATYQNRAIMPTFAQLQPLQPKTNELVQQIGNPDLKRAINNAYNIEYNSFRLLKSSNLNANLSFSTTDNPIVNRTIYDGAKRTTSFENINDKTNWDLNGNVGYSRPVFSNFMVFAPTLSSNFSKSYNYFDGQLNRTASDNYRFNVNLQKQTLSSVDVDLNGYIGVNDERTTLKPENNDNYIVTGANGEIKYYLPYKFNIKQVVYYSFTGESKNYPKSIHQFYMNLELNRKLLKSQDLVLSVKAFDIFNTYNNVNRSFSGNNYSETQQTLLTQYFMVGLKWDFNKNLGKKSND